MGRIFTTRTRSLAQILCLALLFPNTGVTDTSESGVCMAQINREAARHRDYVMRELARFEQTLSELKTDIDSMAADSAEPERLAASLRAIVEAAKPQDPIDEFVDYPVTIVEELYGSISSRSDCPSDLRVSGYFVAFKRAFDEALLSPAYEVELRLAVEDMQADEGLVIVSFTTNFQFDDLVAKRIGGFGEVRVRPKRSGEYHVLVAAKPGTYRWERAGQRSTYLDLRRENFTFTVEAGRINYVGMLQLRKFEGSGFTYYQLDRPAYVLTKIEDRMAEMLDRFPLANGIDPDDIYTDFYVEQRRLHVEKSD